MARAFLPPAAGLLLAALAGAAPPGWSPPPVSPPPPAKTPAASPEGDEAFNGANLLFLNGEHRLAAEDFEKFLKANPSHPKAAIAWFHLGECRTALGNAESAAAAYDAAWKAPGEPEARARALFRLGETEALRGRPGEAAAAFDRFLRENPKDGLAGSARYRLADALEKAGKTAEAKAAYARFLADSPDPRYLPYARLNLGAIELAGGRPREALARFEEVLSGTPDPAVAEPARMNRAECLLLLGRAREAGEAFLAVAESSPERRPRALFLAGRALAAEGRHEEAEKRFEQAAKESPGSPAGAEAEAAAGASRIARAEGLRKAGRDSECLALLEAILAAKPEASLAGRALYLKGQALFALGKFAEAEAAFASAPRTEDSLYAVGLCRRSAGKGREAREAFEACRKAFPGSAAARKAGENIRAFDVEEALKEGDRLLAAKDLAGARKAFEAALAIATEPGDVAAAASGAAWASFQAGRKDEARERFLRAREAAPKGALAAESLQMAALCLEGKDGFGKALRECLDAHPDGSFAAEAHLRLGEVLKAAGKADEAAIHWRAGTAAKGAERVGDACWYRLGWHARAAGKDAPAAEAFLAVVSKWPQSPLAAQSAFLAASHLDRLGKADEALSALARIPPEDATPARADGLFLRADIESGRGRWEPALAAREEVLRSFPKHERRAEALFGKGRALDALGRRDEAVAAFEETAREEASDTLRAARACLAIGEIRIAQKRGDDAIRAFLRATRYGYAEESAQAFLGCARCDLEAGRRAQALERLRQVLRDFPKTAAAGKASEMRREIEGGKG